MGTSFEHPTCTPKGLPYSQHLKRLQKKKAPLISSISISYAMYIFVKIIYMIDNAGNPTNNCPCRQYKDQ
jgi:hypothetical protein